MQISKIDGTAFHSHKIIIIFFKYNIKNLVSTDKDSTAFLITQDIFVSNSSIKE